MLRLERAGLELAADYIDSGNDEVVHGDSKLLYFATEVLNYAETIKGIEGTKIAKDPLLFFSLMRDMQRLKEAVEHLEKATKNLNKAGKSLEEETMCPNEAEQRQGRVSMRFNDVWQSQDEANFRHKVDSLSMEPSMENHRRPIVNEICNGPECNVVSTSKDCVCTSKEESTSNKFTIEKSDIKMLMFMCVVLKGIIDFTRYFLRRGSAPSNRDEILTKALKSLAFTKDRNGCLEAEDGLPYPADRAVKNLFLRECYSGVFDQIVRLNFFMDRNKKLAITDWKKPVYLIWRFLHEDTPQPKKILLNSGTEFFLFDIQHKEVFSLTNRSAQLLAQTCDLYIIDGVRVAFCTSSPTLYIASLRQFVKQNLPIQFCFPVWTYDELKTCRERCYPDVSYQRLNATYEIYGGVARIIFNQNIPEGMLVDMTIMNKALHSSKAVEGIKILNSPTDLHKESHTLLHCFSGKFQGLEYQFLYSGIASNYVGRVLWKKYHNEMAILLQENLGASGSDLSFRLFETYMHLTLQGGNVSLPCRNLSTGKTIPNFELKSRLEGPRALKKGHIPDKFERGVYYEGCDNFPAIDAVIPGIGLMQATIGETHPIKGIQTLREVCSIFKKQHSRDSLQRVTRAGRKRKEKDQMNVQSKVKFYFVVPEKRLQTFKLQKIESTKHIPKSQSEIEQYVLLLDFGISNPFL